MIRFPEDRTDCIITVRKEDYGQFVEDFLSSPETANCFIYPSCYTAEKTLTGRSREEQLFWQQRDNEFLIRQKEQVLSKMVCFIMDGDSV